MRPACASSPTARQASRRVAGQRLLGRQHLSGLERRAPGIARRTAEACPGHARARIEVRDRPVRAERQERAARDEVGAAERPAGALGAERPRPRVRAVGPHPLQVDGLHRGHDALGREARELLVAERLDVLDPVAHARCGAGGAIGVERAADRPVADRVRRALEAGPCEERDGAGETARDRATAARRPRPLESGSSSQAVPGSTTPSMKNFATPPRQRSPRSSRSRVQRSSSSQGVSGSTWNGAHDAHAELAARLELAQRVERRGRSVHRADGGQTGRGHSPQHLGAALLPLRIRRLRHDALDEGGRTRLEQHARRAAVAADDLRAALELARAVDARRDERGGRRQRRVEIEERQQRRRAADRVGDERAVQLDAVERRVLERVSPYPLPGRAARVLGGQRARTSSTVERPARSAPTVSSAPISGCWCASTSPGTSASPWPSIVSVRASQAARTVASSPTATIIPSRQRDRRRPGLRGVERPDTRSEHGEVGRAAHEREPTGTIAAVAAATSPWRAAATFAVTSGIIAISYGVLARASGLSLVMTCAISLLVFAGGAQFLAVATIAAGGTPLGAVIGGVVLNARHLPYGLAIAPFLRGPLWKRALSSQIVLDESTALALSQPTPELSRVAFYACGGMLFVAWNLGTLVGALAGGAHRGSLRAGPRRGLRRQHARVAGSDAAAPRHARGCARGRRHRAHRHAVRGARRADPAGGRRRAGRALREAGRRVTWWAVIALAVGTYALKAAGPLALGSRTVPPQLQYALTLVSVSLLAGLVAISTFGSGRGLALDARAAGLVVACVAVALRAPFAVVVIAAIGCAAALRAAGMS